MNWYSVLPIADINLYFIVLHGWFCFWMKTINLNFKILFLQIKTDNFMLDNVNNKQRLLCYYSKKHIIQLFIVLYEKIPTKNVGNNDFFVKTLINFYQMYSILN